MPKEFNDVKYLAADGYSAIVPTTPETGIQFTATSAAIGATELFSTAFTLADVEFTLGAKNGYSNNFYVSSSAAITAKLRLVTAIKKGTDEPVTVAAELSEDIAFAANKPQKVSLSATMSLLDDKVYELVQGDKIIQTLEIIRTDSASATINVYCNTTYPSTFYLYTGSVVVLEAASVVQEEGTSKTAVMSQDAVTMALAKKLGTPYGVDFPHGAGTVTYDTTDGMHIRGTMRIYTSADKTLFIDVPNTEVEIPIIAGNNISIDKASDKEQVIVKTAPSPTFDDVTLNNTLVLGEEYTNNTSVIESPSHRHDITFRFTYGGIEDIKFSDLLKKTGVKTLFGNQSIVGSGNIDLYRHVIKATGTGCFWATTLISSKNTPIDSLTDLFTALANYSYYPASGYYAQMQKGAVWCIVPGADGGIHYGYEFDDQVVSWTDTGDWTIEDEVTTV